MAAEGEVKESLQASISTTKVCSSIISGVLLSYWDNILGPRSKQLWLGNDKMKITPDIINFVSSHTLNGELCRVREEGQTDTKFYVLSDRECIFFASIFLGMSKTGQTIYSLAFIFAFEDLSRYLELQAFFNKQTEALVMKYRVLQEKDLSTSVKNLSVLVEKLVNTIELTEKSKLPVPDVLIGCTIFGNKDKADIAGLNDSKFLMRAITSHLQTCGCTIVVGSNQDHINFVVNTLALFLTPSERACSRYAGSSKESSYETHLFLQGLLKGPNGYTINSKDVLINSLPTTFIDIDTKEVKQTKELILHHSMRFDFLRQFLSQILEEEGTSFQIKNPFKECEDIAIIVQTFVFEIQFLPDIHSVKKKYVTDFMCLLNQKATTLISYFHSKSLRGVDAISISDIRKMQMDLSLLSEADFQIVLAQAEKICPGIVPFLFKKIAKYESNEQGGDMMDFAPFFR